MYALNLTHSPENLEYWESADPFHAGAGHAASAKTSAKPTPRGPNSIELLKDRRNQASDVTRLLGNRPHHARVPRPM